MKKNFLSASIAVIVGSALFFALGKYVNIQGPIINIYISVQFGVLAFIATLFGPVVGFLIGIIGHFFIDFSAGSVHWSWVIASGITGFIMGLAEKKINLNTEYFSIIKMGILNLYQICAFILTCGVVAPVLDIILYKEPAGKVFVQGIVAGMYDIIATAIIGTLLCLIYSKIKPAPKGK